MESLYEALPQQPLDVRGYVTEEFRDTWMRMIRCRPENGMCFDCDGRNPSWMSLTYGVWLCLVCSGKHRQRGVHVSFVRSSDLDMFTPEQLIRMEVGGNGVARKWFNDHGMSKVDYEGTLAQRYRKWLDGRVGQAAVTVGTAASNGGEADGNGSCADNGGSCAAGKALGGQIDHGGPTGRYGHISGLGAISRQGHGPTAHVPAPNHPPIIGIPPITNVYIPSTKSNQVKAEKLSDDIDFDAMFDNAASMPESPLVRPCSPTRTPVSTASSAPAIVSASKFASAKGFGSADLFGSDDKKISAQERLAVEAKVRQFGDCKAISSDAFHGGGGGVNKPYDQNEKYQQLRENAKQGLQTLASTAQDTFWRARDWLKSNVLEERGSFLG